MVKLMRIAESSSRESTIREALEFALEGHRAQLKEQSLRVDLEIDSSVRDSLCPSGLAAAVESLLCNAIARSPVGSELAISVCRTLRGIEIEIADEGLEHSLPRTNAFSIHRDRMETCVPSRRNAPAARGHAGERSEFPLFFAQCPQGGLAATVVVAARVVVKSMAA